MSKRQISFKLEKLFMDRWTDVQTDGRLGIETSFIRHWLAWVKLKSGFQL